MLFISAYNECVLPVQSLYTAPCKIGLLIALAIMSSLRGVQMVFDSPLCIVRLFGINMLKVFKSKLELNC